MSRIKVGLLGCGVVGKGVIDILKDNILEIEHNLGCQISVERVLVRDLDKYSKMFGGNGTFTNNVDDILMDDELDMIVELIGGIHPAYEYIMTALKNKKHVVTANKAVMALFGPELLETANSNNVSIRYEASVGGGIPIIGTLNDSLASNQINEIVGIINGTTNYILTKMDESGIGFEEALSEAQEKGFAEADPTSDVDGEDAAYKLSILTYNAFGVYIDPNEIPREGIMRISEKEIEFAKQLGYKVKLLASVKRHTDSLEIQVSPALIPLEHPLSAVNNEYNALYIKGNAVEDIMLYGKGAGARPTGSAVVSEIMHTAKIIKNGLVNDINFKVRNNFEPKLINQGIGAYYVRLQVKDQPGVLGNITTTFGKHSISLHSVVQRGRGHALVPLVFITHEVDKEKLDRALKEIEAIDTVDEVASIMRVY